MIALVVIVLVMLAVLVVGAVMQFHQLDRVIAWALPEASPEDETSDERYARHADGLYLEQPLPGETCGKQSPLLAGFECANLPHADEHHYYRNRYWLTDKGWAAVRELDAGDRS